MLIWLWSNNFESTNSYFQRTVLFVITLSHIRGWHNFCSWSVYKYILSIISWVFGIINLGDSASLWKCQSHIQILSALTFHTYRYSSFLNKLDFVTIFFFYLDVLTCMPSITHDLKLGGCHPIQLLNMTTDTGSTMSNWP